MSAGDGEGVTAPVEVDRDGQGEADGPPPPLLAVEVLPQVQEDPALAHVLGARRVGRLDPTPGEEATAEGPTSRPVPTPKS